MWRTLSVITAGMAVLVGTLLLMGNLQKTDDYAVKLEQSRLDALARYWESRLEGARSTFRDQIIRHDVLAVTQHPEEWSPWRVQTKFEAMHRTWNRESGLLRAVALLNPDGRLHTVVGDSARLSEALRLLRDMNGTDAAILGRDGSLREVLALRFQSAATTPDGLNARIVALVDPATLLTAFNGTPSDWTLLSGPENELMASDGSPSAQPISGAAWTLMLSQRSGRVESPVGGTWAFSRVHIPGMPPMLLVHPVRLHAAATGWIAALLSALGLSVLLLLNQHRKPTAPVNAPPTEATDLDAAGYRQIVQCIADPICVVDESGTVLKANRAAQEWLHLRRGRPDEAVSVRVSGSEHRAIEFLQSAAGDPAAASGPCRLWFQDSVWDGELEVSRLYRDEEGHGAVLLHFHAHAAHRDKELTPLAAPAGDNAPDHHSPFPVLSVTPDGLIVAYNEAARRTCMRLEDTPLLSDVLPGMDGRHFADVLAAGNGALFQSLFGPRAHEFTLVFDREQILLYGHPLADSQDLEIEMKQAQENFYGLCALVPSPVLLVDPRAHAVIEANAAAGDLFEETPAGLRGQTLDALSDEPWEPAESNGIFIARTLNGERVTCALSYELIKVEGVPVLMIVLDRLPESVRPSAVAEAPEVEPERPFAASVPPVRPVGPGTLISANPTVREVARRLFDKCGHVCDVFTNLDDAMVWLVTHHVRPEFLAVDLTDFDDVDNWISDLRARCGDVPCIAFTDGETYSLPEGGLNAYLEKPFDLETLQDALSAAHLRLPAFAIA